MSQFKPPSVPSGTALEPDPSPRAAALALAAADAAAPVVALAEEPPRAAPEPPSDIIETIGFVMLCVYLIAGSLNDLMLRYAGNLHIGLIPLATLPVLWLACRNRFRAFEDRMGWWWAGFAICLLVDLPLSIYRRGTFDLLIYYIPRFYFLLFFIAAFVTTLKRCRTLMLVAIAASFISLLMAVKFGVYSDGRYSVAGSFSLSNSNELAMGMLIGIVNFVFLFYTKGAVKKSFAAICIAVSAMYMLKTGSRGCMIAAICYGALMFVISRQKVVALVLALVVGAVGLATLPPATLNRLMLVFGGAADDTADLSALESKAERVELLKRSLIETAKHPIFGIGPGQFPVLLAAEAEKKGVWQAWLGTHNSYTQVSSECGIPAFVCYMAVLVACFRKNHRLYKKARRDPAYREFLGLAITLFSTALVYAICTFFFHMAYSTSLPALAGLTLAVDFAARRVRPRLASAAIA